MKHTSLTRVFDLLDVYKTFHKSDLLNKKEDGYWKNYSNTDTLETIEQLALGMLSLGVKPGDKIAIISTNRPEWNFIDFAVQILGAVTVPLYPTITVEDYAFIFEDSGVEFIFAESEELYLKAKEAANGNAKIKSIYTFEPIAGASLWTEVKELGQGQDAAVLEPIKASVQADDLLTLIYTSGTTGRPKGVMLTHHNIISNVKSLERGDFFQINPRDKVLSFLPMCHIYERTNIYLYLFYGVSIYYAENLDTVAENIREVKPAMFATVPRLLEKVYDKVLAKGNELTGIKRSLFFAAIDFGLKYDPMEKLGFLDKIKLAIFRKLIFSKWQEALGGNIRAITSGSAALQPRLSRIFWAADIPIAEGYGLTETSPVISVSKICPPDFKVGCVGTLLDCIQLKIAEDGEICVKGDSVMPGYYNNPTATAEAIDPDGWFHTGDIGELVDGKYLKITDRKKEIFKTSGGKYVAPQLVENKLKESAFIEQCMVVGEGQKFPSALIIPEFNALQVWCKQQDLALSTPEEMIAHPKVIEKMNEEVLMTMASVARYEQVKKFVLLPRLFTISDGELTPTLKLKRKVIVSRYEKLILGLYE
ncbi:long-chain fatty acid--CoA ligase [Aquirufa nivalisilvae]|uniref:AMP-dependent synthetase/ligase n=1 Tax=Aquirufa nivalisilvae TaxID=2516557 RepID=UPI001032AB2A|nr:long-chain fatty acid--CoA ligase [Aquirufa nivalisilvae]MCZ2479552.1 long-chain fatty acid--CoA ligase [Aquirufa nivalisilvae]MCZ2481542.1 long-chain fatty acid--CoA ligase [Aquirufa nivalisilvae]TBH76357.1 long-chain fatty acid--CoA ligase [Aquirufa nivalisilvae]